MRFCAGISVVMPENPVNAAEKSCLMTEYRIYRLYLTGSRNNRCVAGITQEKSLAGSSCLYAGISPDPEITDV